MNAGDGPIPYRVVPAMHGWLWIREGFQLFRRNPLIWIGLILVWLLITWLLAWVPLIGPLIASLIYPVFLAGLMMGCAALDRGDDLELDHLFVAFRNHPTPLVTVGGINLVAQIAIAFVMKYVGGNALSEIEGHGMDLGNPEAMAAMMHRVVPALLVGATLSVPLMMAMWFTPALLAFRRAAGAGDALAASFNACMSNWLPFSVFGLATFALLLLMPLTLGFGFLVLIPTLLAASYTSYRDLFVEGRGLERSAAAGSGRA